jgi:hypothetical protein
VSPNKTTFVAESAMVKMTLLISHFPTMVGSAGFSSSVHEVPNATNANANEESFTKFFLLLLQR